MSLEIAKPSKFCSEVDNDMYLEPKDIQPFPEYGFRDHCQNQLIIYHQQKLIFVWSRECSKPDGFFSKELLQVWAEILFCGRDKIILKSAGEELCGSCSTKRLRDLFIFGKCSAFLHKSLGFSADIVITKHCTIIFCFPHTLQCTTTDEQKKLPGAT